MGSELSTFSLLSLGVLLGFMTLVWVVSLPLRDASIVDVVWSLNFLVVAVLGVAVGDGVEARRWLLCALVAIWAVRLSTHIFARNHGKGEDYRYQGFRKRYGAERYWSVSLFQVFWLQGALAWFVSLPIPGRGCRGDARGADGGGRGRRGPVGCRLRVRGDRRRAARGVQAGPVERRHCDGPWPVALHPAPNYSATPCCGGGSGQSRCSRPGAGRRWRGRSR